MANFIWTFLGALAVLAVTTIGMSTLIRLYLKRFPLSQPTDFMGGVTLLIVSFISFFFAALSNQVLPQFTLFFLGSCALLFCRLKVDKPIVREGLLWAVCFISVLLFPLSDIGYWVIPAYPFCGLILYGIIHLFSTMDRVPHLSVLTLLTQGFLFLLLTKMDLLPATLLLPMFYIFVAIVAITETTRIFTGFRILGTFASIIAGYMLGLIWMSIIMRGFIWAPLIAFSYDLSEVIWAFMLYPLFHKGNILQKFTVEKAIEKSVTPARLSRYLFFILLLLALLAFMSFETGMHSSVGILLGLTLFGTYYQLNRWGTPQPSFRYIW